MDIFDRIIAPALLGIGVAFFVLLLGFAAYLIPIFGPILFVSVGGCLLIANPGWIKKFWKQKEYRE